MGPKGPTVRIFINDFIKKLDDYLHKNPTTAKNLQNKILRSEKERKDMAGIKKLANKRAKKANLHNKKLRDCHYHFNNAKLAEQSHTHAWKKKHGRKSHGHGVGTYLYTRTIV